MLTERELQAALRRVEPPDEEAAAARAWRRLEATLDAEIAAPPRRRARRLVPALAALALALAAALSPPGEALAEWLRIAAQPAPRAPERAPAPPAAPIPGGGDLLVRSPAALWIVDERGRRRSLGNWDDAAWSPRGRFVAAVRGHELAALDRDGDVRWSLTRPYPLAQPAWSPGDGERIAYRSLDGLRVVAGDGTGDRLLAGPLGPARPAWRPGARHQLSWADRRGRVHLADVDGARLRWRLRPGAPVRSIAWSASGHRLAVVTRRDLRILDARGRLRARVPIPAGRAVTAAVFARRGGALAYALHDVRHGQTAVRLSTPRDPAGRRVFAGRGRIADLAFAPDGAWLLLGWRDADQWVLLGSPYVTGVAALRQVSRRFGDRPRLRGWCCPP